MTLRRITTFWLVLSCGLALAAWLYGLFAFATDIHKLSEPAINAALAATDGIVVLTGGSERLATGVELLKAGKGRKLLVSGVHPGLTLSAVMAHHAVPQNLRECCIALGHAAENTEGNAIETRAWMEAEKFRSLRLVTAHYHMPRSLLIFRKALPDFEIVPYPVAPESVKMSQWWLRPGTASLLITEYNKYLFALARARLE